MWSFVFTVQDRDPGSDVGQGGEREGGNCSLSPKASIFQRRKGNFRVGILIFGSDWAFSDWTEKAGTLGKE
jgi:hypothetical protein